MSYGNQDEDFNFTPAPAKANVPDWTSRPTVKGPPRSGMCMTLDNLSIPGLRVWGQTTLNSADSDSLRRINARRASLRGVPKSYAVVDELAWWPAR